MSKKKQKSASAAKATAPAQRWPWWVPATMIAVVALAIVAGWVVSRSPAAAPVGTLAPIPAPDVLGLDAKAQAALKSQQDTVERLQAATPRDTTALGEAYGRLAQLLLADEQYPAAAPALANAAALMPRDYRWPYYQGYLAVINDKADAALTAYRAALALKPDDVTIKLHLAELYRDQHRADDVHKLLDPIVAADPNSAPAHFILGQIAAEAKDLKTAVDHWETVLRIQPGAALVHRQLAIAYRDLGDTSKSEEQLAQRGDEQVGLDDPLVAEIQRLQSAAGALLVQGGQQMQAGHYDAAAQLFAQAATAEPKNALAALNLGAALLHQDKQTEAEQSLKTAVQLDPSNSQAQFNLGMLAQQSKRTAEAQSAFEAAVAADPKNDDALLALANLERQAGHCAAAAPHYQAYVRDNPTDVRTRRLTVLCLVQSGADAAAVAIAEAGYQINPKDPVTADVLVRLLAAAPDDRVHDGPRAVTLAQAMLRDGIAANPEVLAMAYAEVGRYDEAVGIQEELVRKFAQDLKHVQWVPYLAGNLAAYQKHQSSHQPFPPFAFTTTEPEQPAGSGTPPVATP